MQALTRLIYTITAIIVVIFVIVGVIFLIRHKKGKRAKLNEDEVDYSNFNKKDTKEYIKMIDDICDDMIIVDNRTRFVAVLRCQGYDFYNADTGEQALTAINFKGFTHTITQPVTYRQYSKPINMDKTLKRYQEAYDNTQKEIFNLLEDIREEKAIIRTIKGEQEQVEIYQKDINQKEKQAAIARKRLEHIASQIDYARALSGNHVNPEPIETWIVDWSYNPLDFTIDLTEDEIYDTAKKKLAEAVRDKVRSLGEAHVKAIRCKDDELKLMCKRYSSPIGAEMCNIKPSTAFANCVITSNSISELVQNAKEEMLETDVVMFTKKLETEKELQEPQKEVEHITKNSEPKVLSNPVPYQPQKSKSKVEEQEVLKPKPTPIKRKKVRNATI